jgi:hypothetical protein
MDIPALGETQASFSIAGETEAHLFRGADGHVRLYVLTGNGSDAAEFVHEPGDDRQDSISFLSVLVRHAYQMIEALHADSAA